MNDAIIKIESILDDENVEVLEENNFEETNNIESLPNMNTKKDIVDDNQIISLDRLFTTETDEKLQEEAKEVIKKEDKRIERIQLFLIIFLVVSATIIYFFGYDFFEPYIKIN